MEYGQRKDSSGHPHQEDCIFPEYGKQSDSDRLFILCDGMGGHDAGEVASATVCEAMSRTILSNSSVGDDNFSNEVFDQAVDTAFKALDAKDNGAEKKMGTTMTLIKLHERGVFMAHMGDSRIYHIRPGSNGEHTKILYESSDHSLVNDLIKVGELTRQDARNSKQKNIITRAMQPNLENRPKSEIYETSDVQAGDYFYMCSDGMLEQADMEDGTSLKNVFSKAGGSDADKVKILRKVTENNQDNHSAIIIHITDVYDGDEKHGVIKSNSDDKSKQRQNSPTGKSLVIRILMMVALLMAVILAVIIFI